MKNIASGHRQASKIAAINLFVNYSNFAFAVILNIAFVPIYLSYFNIALYGAWLASGNIVSMLGLLEGGINLALTQKLCAAEQRGDKRAFSSYFTAGFLISMGLSLIIPLVCFGVAPYVGHLVNYGGPDTRDLQEALILSGVSTFLGFSFANLCTVFQAWGIVHYSGIVSVAMVFVGASATLVALKYNLGLLALPMGGIIRGLFGIVALAIFLGVQWRQRGIPLVLSREKFREMGGISLAVSGGRIISSLASNSEGLVISNMIDPKAVAIWNITSRAITMTGGLLNPIGSSIFGPLSIQLAKVDREEKWNTLGKVLKLVALVAAVLLGVSVATNGVFVAVWVGSANYAGHLVDLVTVLSVVVVQRASMLGLFLTACGRPKADAVYSTITSIAQVLMLFLTVRYMGILAVPLSKLVATGLVAMGGYALCFSGIFQKSRREAFALATHGFCTVLLVVMMGWTLSSFTGSFAIGEWMRFACFAGAVLLVISIAVGSLSKDARMFLCEKLMKRRKRVEL